MVLAAVIDLDGPVGWVALLMPFLVLGVVMIGVVVGRDKAPAEHATHLSSQAQSGLPGDQAPAQPQLTPLASERSLPPSTAHHGAERRPAPRSAPSGDRAPLAADRAERGRGGGTATRASLADREADVADGDAARDAAAPGDLEPWGKGGRPKVDGSPTEALEAALAQAEQRFDDPAVARLSLDLARALIGTGATGEAVKTHLRRSIIIASRLKDHETHALARLELGDQMAEEGDMTTACEHWQIARQIYWDAQSDRIGPVDDRMRANGCPTDWVLNDF